MSESTPKTPVPLPQLRMTFPTELLEKITFPEVPDGFYIRTYQNEADIPLYAELMRQAGFDSWTDDSARNSVAVSLPEGLFFVIEKSSGIFAATATAGTKVPEGFPDSDGQLGWVGCAPKFRGKKLGMIACQAALFCFRQHQYKNICLLTDDFRKPALSIYLRTGWIPQLELPGMKERWDAIYSETKGNFYERK